MELEIERKWITDDSIKGEIVRNGFTGIEQAYLSPDARIRIYRRGDGEACICIKKRVSELTVEEYNFPIPLDEATKLLEGMDVIKKTRYNIGVNEDRSATGFTLDVYEGDLEGLLLIEKEYASEEEAAADELPEHWNAVEVTGDPKFLNANLGDKRFDPVEGLLPKLDSNELLILEGDEEEVELTYVPM